LYNDVSVTIAT